MNDILLAVIVSTAVVCGVLLLRMAYRCLSPKIVALSRKMLALIVSERCRSVMKGASICLLLLTVLQFGTYWLFAKRHVSWTLDRFLPQDTHFSKGTHFAFACVSQSVVDDLSASERSALTNHLQHWFPTVYLGEDSIPSTAKEEFTNKRTGKRVLSGLKDGCILDMAIQKRGFMWFHGAYADWEGNLAASSREAIFVWIIGRWCCIWQQEGAMS